MTGASADNPDDPTLPIRAVPDSAARCHLVLPLLELATADLTATQRTARPVLPRRVPGGWGARSFHSTITCASTDHLPNSAEGLNGSDEVGGEPATTRFRKQIRPRELLGQRVAGIQVGKRATQSPRCGERTLGSGAGAVRADQQQRHTVPPPDSDITLVGKRRHPFGVAL
jgi:hypothetical protein